jgi:hypothetical protein
MKACDKMCAKYSCLRERRSIVAARGKPARLVAQDCIGMECFLVGMTEQEA